MSIRSADNQVDNIIDIDIISKIEKNIISSIPSFLPTDLPDLELWLDAEEGVINVAGNNFTDETRSVTIQGFGSQCEPTITLSVQGTVNGRNAYNGSNNCQYGGSSSISWTGTNWNLRLEDYPQEGEPIVTNYNATGDTEYPWQATWTANVSPVATTFDVPATNDETVTRWVNKVSGKPNLDQSTLASQPVFKSDVNGRKAVFFNGDALRGSNFPTFTQQYSYYLVATSLDGANSEAELRTAIRLGTSVTGSRGRFGATISNVFVINGNLKVSSISKEALFGAVWSARFNIASNQVTVGKNLTSELLSGIGTSSANQSTIVIGAANTTGSNSPIVSNFSEVLVYRTLHNEATANQVINYLIQKWNISV